MSRKQGENATGVKEEVQKECESTAEQYKTEI